MSFCTVVNCMDGRTQLPVNEFLRKRFGTEYVDTVTEPGPNLILAKQTSATQVLGILNRINVSVHHHGSKAVAVVGHHGCAGNPAPKADQIAHLREAVAFLRGKYPSLTVLALWVDENWAVSELSC
jgi:carbonic anhydrase